MMRLMIRAWVAGFLATIAFALMAYSVFPMVTGGVPLDVAAMLGEPLGEDWLLGLIALFVLGTVVAPTVYAGVLRNLLPGREPFRSVMWGSLLWVGILLSIARLNEAGPFSHRAGGLFVSLGLLVGLLAYGAMFGAVMKETPGSAAAPRAGGAMPYHRAG